MIKISFWDKVCGMKTERNHKNREREKEEKRLTREAKLKEKKVLKVAFKCENCSAEWIHEYPARTKVGFSGLGPPSNIHPWIMDTYGLYTYNCPNCDESDIDIKERSIIY
ncbi:hypothetical protein LCGC14_1756470 [marine sediment metagenome]|uniref:Uncharacterized protein n=1 Tax=marine sediment metagenome TaxID=412755 RepID=A0A0F9H2D1_9ZZZZ